MEQKEKERRKKIRKIDKDVTRKKIKKGTRRKKHKINQKKQRKYRK